MYISSDGTEKDVKQMNSEYIINGLAKSLRDIFTSENMKDYEKYMNNIDVLNSEIMDRINKFVEEKGADW